MDHTSRHESRSCSSYMEDSNNVAQAKHGRLRPSLFTHRFNMRGKIAMPVPGNSRGKFARVLVSHFTPDDESKVQLHDFVDRVHNGIKKMVADCAKVSSIFRLVDCMPPVFIWFFL
ncbi:hypothetical protein NC652_030144 [Populus alba x Populus x berolinensis]|nr:hypothetical protein NC652_030144 [Populus alba x Populus x berolinensis]